MLYYAAASDALGTALSRVERYTKIRNDGVRLKVSRGKPLRLRRAEIPPEGTAPGAVQVPGDGKPIVLGPDRPVTGGYPKIATVISADLPVLAQARPGARVRFRRVDLAAALEARKGQRSR